MFESIKIISEENYDVNDINISQLEQESDRLVQSIRKSDCMVESLVNMDQHMRESSLDAILRRSQELQLRGLSKGSISYRDKSIQSNSMSVNSAVLYPNPTHHDCENLIQSNVFLTPRNKDFESRNQNFRDSDIILQNQNRLKQSLTEIKSLTEVDEEGLETSLQIVESYCDSLNSTIN